jgi:hypothetical protein
MRIGGTRMGEKDDGIAVDNEILDFWDSLPQKHHPSREALKFWDSLFQN